jgi:quinol monooxygenase YgiN
MTSGHRPQPGMARALLGQVREMAMNSMTEGRHDSGTAVVLTVRLVASRDALRRELEALVGPVRAQPGCRHCAVMRDAEAPGVVTLVEEWETRADLDRHFRSEECRRLLALVELGDAPPELYIDSVAVREGLEAIAAARGQAVKDDFSGSNHQR